MLSPLSYLNLTVVESIYKMTENYKGPRNTRSQSEPPSPSLSLSLPSNHLNSSILTVLGPNLPVPLRERKKTWTNEH